MKKRFMHFGLGVVCMGLLGGAVPASASLLTYSDFSAWSAAVSGVTAVTTPNATQFLGFGNVSATYSDVTFSSSAALSNGYLFTVGTGAGGVISNQQQLNRGASSVSDILITFPTAVSGFALGYGDWANSPVTFTTSSGETFTQNATSGRSFAVTDFAGATGSSFTWVLVTSTGNVGSTSEGNPLNIGHIFYATDVAVSEAPEPMTPGLVFCGLFVFALVGRRTHSVAK